ncbi:flavodoxin family protein [Sungkyunkwania multivorans]|uniref:Flavodoxin family protein n=1 Tax=Sungkyunkwania multivorans TaxID=1173618 RepID=A0ABW3CS61_9FLAO
MKTENQPTFDHLKALYINCTLKPSGKLSHTEGLIQVSMNIMKAEKVQVDYLRLVDYNIAYGLLPDMKEDGAEKDDWPVIYEKVMDADILIIGTPIWLGEKSSIATLLIERLYGMSGKTNDKGQYIYYGKVGGTVITGNEDGIKHCAMGILYALQHLGYSIPPQADCGWIGEAGPGPSYMDEESGAKDNQFTNRNTTFMTYNLLHLASMLKKSDGLPSYGNSRKEWDDGTRWNFENPEYR